MFGHVSVPYQSHEKIICFQQYHLSEIGAQFTHLFVTNLTFIFYVSSIDEESTEDMLKTLTSYN